MGSAGRAVYAVADGVLTQRYTNTGTAGWGWTLYVAATNTSYKYFHLAEDANGLVQGAKVSRGDVLGFVGEQRNVERDQLPPALRGATEQRRGESVAAVRLDPAAVPGVAAVALTFSGVSGVSGGRGRAG